MAERAVKDQGAKCLRELRPQLQLPDGVAEGNSYLSSELRRLQAVPLNEMRLEDLRLLIGQEIALDLLVPRALEHLAQHPLASGDFYPGDLLKVVAQIEEPFWNERPQLRRQLVTALNGAIARLRKKDRSDPFIGELSAALAKQVQTQ